MGLRDPVAVYNAATNVEAQLICNILNDAGVEAFVTEDTSPAGVWMFGTLPEIHKPQVWVDRSSLDRAKPLLDDYERRSIEREEREEADSNEVTASETLSPVAFVCEECGKSITFPAQRRGHVETCPHCGSYVDVPERTQQSLSAESQTTMSDEMPGSEQAREPKTVAPLSRTTRQLWIEVSAILFLAFIPDLFHALAFVLHPASVSFPYRGLSLIVRAFQVSTPLLVILALTKEPWSQFGIVRPKWITDAFLGCAIWLGGNLAYYFIMSLLPPTLWERSASWQIAHRVRPEGITAVLLFLVASVANSFAEELVMRGYLIGRLQRLLRSNWLAVVVTTALFAAYHCYQGVVGVIGAAVLGLVYGMSFCLFRRLWPLWVAHTLANFTSL